MPPRLSSSHLLGNLETLAAIGAIEGGGCARLALTDEDKAGRDLVAGLDEGARPRRHDRRDRQRHRPARGPRERSLP